jgi:hypothetical protein
MPSPLVGLEVFTATIIDSIMFWDMTPCTPGESKKQVASSQFLELPHVTQRELYCVLGLRTCVSYVTQVFSGCGKPLLGRRRRDTTELEFESLQFGRSEDAQNGESNIVPTLDKLVKDIRQKVRYGTYSFCNLCLSLVYVG